MDELKLILSTKFMKNIVTKIVAKAIKKKLGYDIDILVNQIAIEAIDGKIHLHADVDAEVDKAEFVKIIKSVGLD